MRSGGAGAVNAGTQPRRRFVTHQQWCTPTAVEISALMEVGMRTQAVRFRYYAMRCCPLSGAGVLR